MVVVKMSVDDIADGLAGDCLEVLLESARSGWRCSCINDEYITVTDDRDVIAAGDDGTSSRRIVNTISDFFEFVRLTCDDLRRGVD